MGMYDYPDFEESNKVSIFLAKKPINDFPEDYFEENYGGEDEEEFNLFSYEFGFGVYDHDFMDTNGGDSGEKLPIKELLRCSYFESFIDEATEKAEEIGLSESSWVVLLYNFNYDPQEAPRSMSDYMIFLGSFDYRKN